MSGVEGGEGKKGPLRGKRQASPGKKKFALRMEKKGEKIYYSIQKVVKKNWEGKDFFQAVMSEVSFIWFKQKVKQSQICVGNSEKSPSREKTHHLFWRGRRGRFVVGTSAGKAGREGVVRKNRVLEKKKNSIFSFAGEQKRQLTKEDDAFFLPPRDFKSYYFCAGEGKVNRGRQ